MRSWRIAGSLGMAVPAFLPELPPVGVVAWACLGGLFLVYSRRFRFAGFLLLGGFFACLHAFSYQVRVLPESLSGQEWTTCGVVEGLPAARPFGTRFLLRADAPAGWLPGPKLLLYASQPVEWRPGQRACLRVKTKTPRGLANRHGFDYERWLAQRGIVATGSVRAILSEDAPNTRDGGIDGWRAALRDRLRAALPAGSPASGILLALVMGDRGALTDAQRDLFQRTGTAHLMAISGLHVALVAGLAFALAAGFTRRAGLGRWLPAPRAGAVASLLAALGYGLLSGWGLPVQRACLMLACALVPLLAGYRARTGDTLALAVFGVLWLDPLAVRDAGFWLSFGAVAILLYTLGGRPADRSRWRRWCLPQVALGTAMTPLLLAQDLPVSAVSLPANLLAVPVTGLLVLPLALLGTLLERVIPQGAWLLHVAAQLMTLQLELLDWLAQAPLAPVANPAPAALILAGLGLGWLLAPRGVPARWAGFALCLPLVLPPRPALAPGSFEFGVLDVGQGLAVLVRTRNHVLLYDAGNGGAGVFDTGRAVVLPGLRGAGVFRIDHLLVSHGDRDHAGGVAAVRTGMPVQHLVSGVPALQPAGPRLLPCHAGTGWEWDGVRFDLLHPAAGTPATGNNASCVLRVKGAGGRLLLPGDIERAAEHALVAGQRDALRAEVLVAPHHGSRTSSSPAFVRAVGANLVIFSAAWQGRFGHPHPRVVARFRATGARILHTGQVGAVWGEVPVPGPPRVRTVRETQRAWWRARLGDEDPKPGVVEYLRQRYWQGIHGREGSEQCWKWCRRAAG